MRSSTDESFDVIQICDDDSNDDIEIWMVFALFVKNIAKMIYTIWYMIYGVRIVSTC